MHTSIEKMEIGIEFSDMKIIEIEVTFVYRNITTNYIEAFHSLYSICHPEYVSARSYSMYKNTC
jgi:hypothetical protein